MQEGIVTKESLNCIIFVHATIQAVISIVLDKHKTSLLQSIKQENFLREAGEQSHSVFQDQEVPIPRHSKWDEVLHSPLVRHRASFTGLV